MIVHFIAARDKIDKHITSYRAIIDSVLKLGHEIARYWVDNEYRFVKNGIKHSSVEWEGIVSDNAASLARADVVIADVSEKSFSAGYQISEAIHQKKPVLIISNKATEPSKYISGIKSEFVEVKHYSNKDEISGIIEEFLLDNTIENKDLRFNFFIDKKIYNYLRWSSYRTHKSKSEILRDLVLKEINKEN